MILNFLLLQATNGLSHVSPLAPSTSDEIIIISLIRYQYDITSMTLKYVTSLALLDR